jgi:glycosyltransferase involved in cell wall biosynthesis
MTAVGVGPISFPAYAQLQAQRRVQPQVKILVVHNPYQQLGGEDVVFDQECRMLRNAGHEVITYVRSNEEVKQFVGLQRLALVPHTIWARDSRREFAALLQREKPSIVHVHNTFVMISPSIFSACHEAGIPVVHTLHNYRLLCAAGIFYRDGHVCEDCVDKGLWSGVVHGCYHNSMATTAVVTAMIAVHRGLHTWAHPGHFYIALSEFARRKFIKSGIPEDRVFLKPNFVDPDPTMPTEKDEYAVFAGRLSPEKRVSTLLDGWERGRTRFPLFILGGGPEQSQLAEVARLRGLSGIHFKGHLPRPEVIATIRKARFLVFSSEWYENFPVTIAEAFGTGTPVICSRLGAMEEIVTHGRNGLHFTPGRADDLAEKMDWAWCHPEELSAMGREARHDFETKYTADINYKLLMNIYNQVIERTNVLAPQPA